IIIAITEWLKNKNIKETFKIFLISYSIVFLIVAPWTYRNYKHFNLLIPVSYNGGYVLFINNNSNNQSGAWMRISDIDLSNKMKSKFKEYKFYYKGSIKNEINQVMLKPELNNIFRQEAKRWILHHPNKFIKMGILRIKNTFFNGSGYIYQWAINSNAKNNYSALRNNYFSNFFNAIIYILDFFGFFYVVYNFKYILISFFNKELTVPYIKSILVLNILYFVFISFVFEGQQRYNFPILFLCAISMINCVNIFYKMLS
ncbi:hypothetical protein CFK35_19275, partial [Clostridium sp. cpc1]|nr:hypothetical protein [Clostridium sp. cpc1]